jgi:hypothetical protein
MEANMTPCVPATVGRMSRSARVAAILVALGGLVLVAFSVRPGGSPETVMARGLQGDALPYRLDLVAQTGGATNAIVADPGEPDVVYIGWGPRVASVYVGDPTAPRLIARSAPLPGIVHDLVFQRDIVYAAFDAGTPTLSVGGVAALDVAAPMRPQVIGIYESDVSVRRLVVFDHYVVGAGSVGGRGRWAGGPGEALVVVDVANPLAPAEVGRQVFAEPGAFTPFKQPAELALVGHTAFLARHTLASPQVFIHAIDLADPVSPREIGHLSLPGRLRGMSARGTVIYVVVPSEATGRPEVHAVDASRGGVLTDVGRLVLPGVYCTDGVRMADGGERSLLLVDPCGRAIHRIGLASPSRPTLTSSLALGHPATSAVVASGTLWLGAGDAGGLRAYPLDTTGTGYPSGYLDLLGSVAAVASAGADLVVTHPAGGAMRVARASLDSASGPDARLDLPDARAVAAVGDRLVVAGGTEGKVYITRIEASGAITTVGTVETGGVPDRLAVGSGRIYVAAGAGGVHAIDPTTGVLVTSNREARSDEIVVDDRRGYTIATDSRDLMTLDADSLAALDTQSGELPLSPFPSALAAADRRVYRAAGGFELSGLYGILDVFDATEPHLARLGTTCDLRSLIGDDPGRMRIDASRLFVGGGDGLVVLGLPVGATLDFLAHARTAGVILDLLVEPDPGTGASQVVLADSDGGIVAFRLVPGSDPTPVASVTPVPAPTRTPTTSAPPSQTPAGATRVFLPSALRGTWRTGRETRFRLTRTVDGPSFDFAWVGDIVYRTEGDQLVALDVTDPALPREVWRSEAFGGLARGLDVAAPLAVLVTSDGRIVTLGVADPRAPLVLGRAAIGSDARDVVLRRGYAYVATSDGLVNVDMLAPSRPRVAGRIDVPGGVERLAIHAGFLYALGGVPDRAFRVYDLAEGGSPAEVAQIPVGLGGGGVRIAFGDRHAYVLDADVLTVYDVSDPRAPGYASDHFLQVLLTPQAMAVSGDRLYLAGQEGLAVFDLQSPAMPMLRGQIETRAPDGAPDQAGVTAIEARGEGVLALCGPVDEPGGTVLHAAHLRAFDVRDPALPVLAAVERSPNWTVAIRRDGSSLYLLEHSARAFDTGLLRYDLAAPGVPAKRGLVPLGIADIAFRDGIGYAIGWGVDTSTLAIIDVSAWPAVTPHGMVPLPGGGDRVVLAGDRALVLEERIGDPAGSQLTLVDVASTIAPRVLGSTATAGQYWSGLAADGDLAVTVGYGKPGLAVWDTSGPAGPRLVGAREDLTGTGVAVAGGRAYVASAARFDIVDLTAPGAPRRLGSTPVSAGYGWKLELEVVAEGDLVLIASHRLVAVDVADPSAPRQSGEFAEPAFEGVDDFTWAGLATSDDHAYIVGWGRLTGSLGLTVARVGTPVGGP